MDNPPYFSWDLKVPEYKEFLSLLRKEILDNRTDKRNFILSEKSFQLFWGEKFEIVKTDNFFKFFNPAMQEVFSIQWKATLNDEKYAFNKSTRFLMEWFNV